jgi:hypothetical protein
VERLECCLSHDKTHSSATTRALPKTTLTRQEDFFLPPTAKRAPLGYQTTANMGRYILSANILGKAFVGRRKRHGILAQRLRNERILTGH